MKVYSRYLAAGGIACAALFAASGAFAAATVDSVNGEIAQINELLAAQPSAATQTHITPSGTAGTLRDDALASLRAGNVDEADQQAKLALRQLGEDGTAPDQTAYTCIGGCPGSILPAVSADALSQGAPALTRPVPEGKAARDVTAAPGESNDGASNLAQTQN